MKTDEVQALLSRALNHIEDYADRTAPEVVVATLTLTAIRSYSNSGNNIPAIRGAGLEEAVELANAILKYGTKSLRINTKSLAQSATWRVIN